MSCDSSWSSNADRDVLAEGAAPAIMLGGHKADAATWFEGEGWVIERLRTLRLLKLRESASSESGLWKNLDVVAARQNAYLYDEKAAAAVPPGGWDLTFPMRSWKKRR